jgi:outer membrane lipoprotein SlyB
MEAAVRRPHPLVLTAAAAVTVFSLTGVAALTGLIPNTRSTETAKPVVASVVEPTVTPAAPAPAEAKPAPVVAPKPVAPAPRPAPVQKPVVHSPPPAPVVVARNEVPPARVETIPPVLQGGSAPVPPVAAPQPAYTPCFDCGTIESVRQVAQAGQGTGFGAIAGAIGGGVLGHQVGNGRGRDVGTVVGAIGGAVAGHQAEKYVRRTSSYEIAVRMEDGTTQVVTQADAPIWRPGDRVKLQNGVLRPAG